MNKVMMLARLVKDPDIRAAGNKAVASFSIAVNRRFSKPDGPKADFFNVVVWEKTAEFAGKYLKKGSQIVAVGRMENRQYEKDGQMKWVTELIADELYFADSKPDEGGFPMGDD